jgi:hypothetical protein
VSLPLAGKKKNNQHRVAGTEYLEWRFLGLGCKNLAAKTWFRKGPASAAPRESVMLWALAPEGKLPERYSFWVPKF